MPYLKRREFILLLGGAAAAASPLVARAQQSGGMRRIGVLTGTAQTDPEMPLRIGALREALTKLGWSENRNVVMEVRWGSGDPERMRAYAKELVALKPDVVVAESTPAAVALRRESAATLIVFLQVANPVGSGLVASLARPGGNATGFTNFEPAMGGKWLELLKEIAPGVTRVIAIFNPDTHSGQYWQTADAAARSLAVEFAHAPARDAAAIESAVAGLAREPGGGVVVMPDAFTLAHRELIIALTARHRLPSISPFSAFTTTGGLLCYGIDQVETYRLAASYVDRILKGEKPSDLPVQAPTKFELIINLKTAKALGLDVPWFLQQRADEVIE
jgi:putative ABC transport system substrate-binding protein